MCRYRAEFFNTQAKSLNKHRGFTLLELAIVLVIAGVLMVMAAETFKTYVQYRQVDTTRDNVDYAIEQIRAFQQKYGYLPCPASPQDPALTATDCTSNAAIPGMVVGQATGVNGQTIRIGVLPVSYTDPDTGRVTKFVSGDKTIDGWKNRLTYAVVEQMAQSEAAFTAAGAGTIRVDNVPADPANPVTQSARYVVFSHGPDGVGAYSQNGALRAPCVDGASVDSENCDGDAVFSGRMESPRSNTEDANNFDDFITSDDDQLGSITCPADQELRGFNLTTKQPVCAARDLQCTPAQGSFVGVEWIPDAGSPTGMKMKSVCRPFSAPCNAGMVLARVDADSAPVCIQNNQGNCPAGYVQSGNQAYADTNKDGVDDITGAAIAFGVQKCARIANDCGPNQVQVGISDGAATANNRRGAIAAGLPLCADRMKNDTCTGDQMVVGYKPDGTPQCSDVPHCTGGKVVSGIDGNGNVICTQSVGDVDCPDGEVIRSIKDGVGKCEKLNLGNATPLYSEQISYDYQTGQSPADWNAEMDAAIQSWPPAAGLPATQAGYRAACFVDGDGHLPPSTIDRSMSLDSCLYIMCRYKTSYYADLTQLIGNCGVNDQDCGGAGRKGFGLVFTCMHR